MPTKKPWRLSNREGISTQLILIPHIEKVAMEPFMRSQFGAFLQRHFTDGFTKPSQQSFLLLALGWCLSPSRHTVANYLWRAGACAFKHFTCFYAFLGGPFYDRLDGLWIVVIKIAARYVPDDQPLRVRVDATTSKKTGRSIDGASTYRNGAGTARQEYRTLFGLNFVIAEMLIRLGPWPDALVSVPCGLALYVKKDKAEALGVPYQRPSELAREMLDRVCAVVGPERKVLSVQDGDYSTQYFLRDLPKNAEVVGRFPINSPLYAVAKPKAKGTPGPQAKKGARLGTAKTLAEEQAGWQPHPSEPGAEVCVIEGLWQSVLPGVVLRVVLVRRPALKQAKSKRQRQKWLEAFFTTDRSLSLEEILAEYRGRWTIEITISAARQDYGLGQDRCRRYRRIVGINAFRLVIAAAQVLWFAEAVEEVASMDLVRYRPWYLQKQAPSLHDVVWACREHLNAEGITPKVGFWETMEGFHGNSAGSSGALPRAA